MDILLDETENLVNRALGKRPKYSMISSCWSILLRLALKSADTLRPVGKLSVEDSLFMQEDQRGSAEADWTQRGCTHQMLR